MDDNSTLINVPRDITNPLALSRFLQRIVEKIDLAYGYRGDSPFSYGSDITALYTYVDAQDVITLASAKSYADAQDVITLASANSYTDSAVALSIVTKTTDYTLVSADDTVLLDGSSNTVDLTLLPAATITSKVFTIKCIDDTFTVTVTPDGTETIDGDTGSFQLYKDEIITIQSNGTGWYIL